MISTEFSPRLREIAEACWKAGAQPEFVGMLTLCKIDGENDLLIVLSGPEGIDSESLAHNIGATMRKDCRVNGWFHGSAPGTKHVCAQLTEANHVR
jgi:hypothetical protein